MANKDMRDFDAKLFIVGILMVITPAALSVAELGDTSTDKQVVGIFITIAGILLVSNQIYNLLDK